MKRMSYMFYVNQILRIAYLSFNRHDRIVSTSDCPAASNASEQVFHARSKLEVNATSNLIPRSPIKVPASIASASPVFVRGTSHQPVNLSFSNLYLQIEWWQESIFTLDAARSISILHVLTKPQCEKTSLTDSEVFFCLQILVRKYLLSISPFNSNFYVYCQRRVAFISRTQQFNRKFILLILQRAAS